MKKLIALLIFIFSCSQKSQLIYEGDPDMYEGNPVFSENVLLNGYYSDCENFSIPTASVINICSDNIISDTLIDLSKLDQRFKLKLSIDWGHGYVKYINMIKKGKLLKKINLDSYVDRELIVEARVGLDLPTLFCLTIDFVDVNLDSYLDIRIQSNCGNPCLYSFWLYNPLEEVFDYWDESPINIINFNCKKQMIYSSSRFSAHTLLTSYKIDSTKRPEKYAEQDFLSYEDDTIIWKMIKNNR